MRRLSLACLATVAACAYDWSTGPLPDAGDAGAAEGGVDAGDAGDAIAPDAPAPDAADCAALLAAVHAAKVAAKSCRSIAMECTTTVTDECGCTQIVAEQNQAWADYKTALAAFAGAKCMNAVCGTCPTTQTGLCVVGDAGGALACAQ